MKINKKISSYNHTKYKDRTIKYLVLHYVGAESSAKNNADYFFKEDKRASAHYFVDDRSIWQAVEDKNAAWHCGGGVQGNGGRQYYGLCSNSNSIGVEMCCQRKSGKLYITEKTLKNTSVLVQSLQKKYKIPDSRVIRHYDVTGKLCPAPYIKAAEWKKAKEKLTGNPLETNSKSLSAPTAILRRGSVGEQVKKLQQCLNHIMKEDLEIDGSFGPATDKALRAFQKKYGLAVDGSYGPKSRAKLKELI